MGGEWHIRDITNTMTTVAFFLLKHAAQNREHWLQQFYEIEKEAVRPRKDGELQGYEIASGGGNVALLHSILQRGGVHADYGQPIGLPKRKNSPFHMFIPIDQPYAGFAKALLESQHYPDLRDATGRPIPPYDVTAHTLTLLMNIDAKPIYALLHYKKVLVEEDAELDYYGREAR